MPITQECNRPKLCEIIKTSAKKFQGIPLCFRARDDITPGTSAEIPVIVYRAWIYHCILSSNFREF